MEDVLFSIIIPTYNRSQFIKNVISSILNQTYSNFEIIIVDDGSTDNTEETILSISDSRLHYYKKENEERSIARNFGIRKAKGKFITFVDSDDVLYENHLEEAVQLLSSYKDPVFFHLAYEIRNVKGEVLSRVSHKGNVNLNLLKGNILSCIGVFVKKEILLDHMFSVDRNLIGSEDWELWVRLASRYKIYYSNTVTSAIIQHDLRSVLNQDVHQLITRIDLAYSSIFADKEVVIKFSRYKNLILSYLWVYLALHLAMMGKQKLGWKYIIKCFLKNPFILFTRRFLVVIYKLILP